MRSSFWFPNGATIEASSKASKCNWPKGARQIGIYLKLDSQEFSVRLLWRSEVLRLLLPLVFLLLPFA